MRPPPARTPAPARAGAASPPPVASARRSRRRVTTAAALALGVLGSALVGTATGAAGASANLVVNGGFESGTAGWSVPTGTSLASVPGRSGLGVRVANPSTAARTTALNDAVNTVSSTVPGRTYETFAWVRAHRADVSVTLRLMEYAGSTFKGQAQAPLRLTDRDWHRLTVRYTAVSAGASLDLNVVASQLPAGAGVEVDGARLFDLSTPTTPTDPTPPGWRTVWSDEFDGTTLDHSKWDVEDRSTYGDGNNELACLMDRPENVLVHDGVLSLRARREAPALKCGSNDPRFPGGRPYSSGHLTTKTTASFTYGRFELRARLPTQAGTSQGLWPAFWMRPVSGGIGELDVMEAVGSGPTGTEFDRVHHTLWYDYVGTHSQQPTSVRLPGGARPSDGMHTYAAEWEPGEIRWYVDGVLTYTRTRATTPWLDEAFSRPFYLRLNLAVGGGWPGSPTTQTALPADFDVDYVRVYQR